jgi:hypothetical protein
MNYTDEQCEGALALWDQPHYRKQLEGSYPGITAAVRRYQAKLRKRNSRASAEQRIELPLPAGTAAALRRVCEAAGDEPVAAISRVIHVLDEAREKHPEIFKYLTTYRTDVTDVAARYAHLVGGDTDE